MEQWSDLGRPDSLVIRGTFGGAKSGFHGKRSLWTPGETDSALKTSNDVARRHSCSPRRIDHRRPEGGIFQGIADFGSDASSSLH